MQEHSDASDKKVKITNFGCIPVDTSVEKQIFIDNNSDKYQSYRITSMDVLNNVDRVFLISITSTPVKPGQFATVKIKFKPNIVGQSFTEYFQVNDTAGNSYNLTATGRCYGPNVYLDKTKLVFKICKNVTEQRKEVINITNISSVDTTYQWYIPLCGQGYFQISTGNCGLIRANETISTAVLFIGTALGVYTAELVCLVLNQEPLFLNVVGTIVLPGNPMVNLPDHSFHTNWKQRPRYVHLMENSLNRLTCIPSASVFERYLEFGRGSVSDITKNSSQTICVTNHEQEEGYMQWMPDPDNVFIVDPISCVIPSNESRLFAVRFRPKQNSELYGYLMCGDFQYKRPHGQSEKNPKLKHTWFRIPCTGHTWPLCEEWITEWDVPVEIIMPPTVPTRTTFTNFMLSNKLEIPMHFKFNPPYYGTNFVVLPICGIVQGRGWQIISVALEPKCFGDYCETWDLVINNIQKTRVCFTGNAEMSQVEVMSHGIAPTAHALLEFQPTITGCTNYVASYLHNLTRMDIHVRILNYVPWLGADFGGSIVLPPKEIVNYHWWFFPMESDKVYATTITLSCVCLIDGRPVGEPTEVYIRILGFSEFPDLKVLPKTKNLHDVVVGKSMSFAVTLYNSGSCYFTSKLYHEIDGMGDDYSGDRFEIDSAINTLKPSNHCQVLLTVVPDGAGPRQIEIKYTVLFRSEFDEIEEIQPITKRIAVIWYDGIYPTIEVKRTLSVKSPIILSNHDVWNMTNVDELNKAFVECRPKKPLTVNIYGPNLCVNAGNDSEVIFVFVLGCVYSVMVPWSLRREKLCDCEMVEVKVATSHYEMKHSCVHRSYVEMYPLSGIVSENNSNLIYLKLNYVAEGEYVLSYVMTLPNQRIINILIHIEVNSGSKGVLAPLRRTVGIEKYLAVLDCGRVPINNLDETIRIIWLYNPTNVFTTWRLLRGNAMKKDSAIRCLLFFAEIPPLSKLAIPIAFMPTEMKDYEVELFSSFGYQPVKMLVRGQGGLPNSVETRLDIPFYTQKVARKAYRKDVVYLSMQHLTLPPITTHALSREILCICNDTDHVIRFIWLPERIANIVNVVMTPCWGVIQPHSAEWITMTVYTLQEPAIYTTSVSCEILDLTERKLYQQNEVLRQSKIETCQQEFIITEAGVAHPGLNDFPPYVLDLKKPQPYYLTMSLSIASLGQRDGYTRLLLRQMWDQVPPYDLLSSDVVDNSIEKPSGNNLSKLDIVRTIDGILWDAMHSKMFRNQLEFYCAEEIPDYDDLVNRIEKAKKSQLSRRVTAGICDAIVNKAIFHIYDLTPKNAIAILEAE